VIAYQKRMLYELGILHFWKQEKSGRVDCMAAGMQPTIQAEESGLYSVK
jgi:hypothetical protein